MTAQSRVRDMDGRPRPDLAMCEFVPGACTQRQYRRFAKFHSRKRRAARVPAPQQSQARPSWRQRPWRRRRPPSVHRVKRSVYFWGHSHTHARGIHADWQQSRTFRQSCMDLSYNLQISTHNSPLNAHILHQPPFPPGAPLHLPPKRTFAPPSSRAPAPHSPPHPPHATSRCTAPSSSRTR